MRGSADEAVTEKGKSVDASAMIRKDAKLLLIRIDEMIAAKIVKPSNLRVFTGALKDLKEVLDAKSRRDIRLQEARIRALQKATEDNARTITVAIESGDEFAN